MAKIRNLLDERTSEFIRDAADVSVENEARDERLYRLAVDFSTFQRIGPHEYVDPLCTKDEMVEIFAELVGINPRQAEEVLDKVRN